MSIQLETNEHSVEVIPVQKTLIEWGQTNFRVFPWRMTRDPYKILLSEIMLHRTQARQVVPVYESFIQIYPDIRSLSQAGKEELNAILYSLGLRWRIDLIQDMACELANHYNGDIPQDKEDLLSLPGVSEYIAGAVRCFAWNLPEAIPDTNTVRITGRLFCLTIKKSSRRNPLFRHLIAGLVPSDQPRAFNYAQLDLAHQVCTSKHPPDCSHCPLLQWCCYGNSTITQKQQG